MTNISPPPGRISPIRSRRESANWIRGVNIVLGVWLFVSAFIWPHTDASRTNTWILGVIIAAVGAAGMAVPGIRWVNTAAAVWLFFSTLWIYHISGGTAWNNAVVAIVVFALSLASNANTSRANPP